MINNDVKALLKYIRSILFDVEVDEAIPTGLAEDEDFLEIRTILETIRKGAGALGKGDLSCQIKGKGYIVGCLKSLQASLKNLTWKTKAIAHGDFAQNVDFLGEFSDAFNSMTKKLEDSMLKLKESEEIHRLLADNASDVIWVLNTDGEFTYVSPSVEKLRGYTAEEVKRQSPEQALCPNFVDIMRDGLKEISYCAMNNLPVKTFRGELEQPCKDGSTVWTETTVSGIYDEKGILKGVLGVSRDITKRRKMEEEIIRLSITDKLTQVYNRSKIDEVLEQQLEHTKISGLPFGIIMVDIDYFKRVNDTFGHPVGDAVLVEFAEILKNNVGELDIIGRWGGEEFFIVLPQTDEAGAKILAEKLRILIQNNQFAKADALTSSFGVAAYAGDRSTASIVLRADKALYRAKQNGRNRVEAD